jgi:CRISPR-associated protein Csx17
MIVRWVPPLSLIDWSGVTSRSGGQENEDMALSPAAVLHAFLRPLFEPDPIEVDGRPLFPIAASDSRRPHAAAIRMLVHMLRQNRIDDAIAIARRRYLASGVAVFDAQVEQPTDGERLAAALLIPVDRSAIACRFKARWLKTSKDHWN